jgi:hypothetical protein
MNFKITFEITEKELAQALLPNGGKITEVEVTEKATRRRRTSTKDEASPKPRASSRKKTAQTKEA